MAQHNDDAKLTERADLALGVVVQQPEIFAAAPSDVIAELNKCEAAGVVTVLTFGVASHFALFTSAPNWQEQELGEVEMCAGHKAYFNSLWEKTEEGAGPVDALRGALRYWNPAGANIIAMTSVAKLLLDGRLTASENASLLAEQKKAEQQEIERNERQSREALRESLTQHVKFKKDSVRLSMRNGEDAVVVDAWVRDGLAVHKSLRTSAFEVSHVESGLSVVRDFATSALAKMAAVRIAGVASMARLSAATSCNGEFQLMRGIIKAMVAGKGKSGTDPLVQPTIEADFKKNAQIDCNVLEAVFNYIDVLHDGAGASSDVARRFVRYEDAFIRERDIDPAKSYQAMVDMAMLFCDEAHWIAHTEVADAQSAEVRRLWLLEHAGSLEELCAHFENAQSAHAVIVDEGITATFTTDRPSFSLA